MAVRFPVGTVRGVKRLAFLLASAVLVPALGVLSLQWFDRASGYRNDQVEVNSIVFGLDRIKTLALDEMGIDCRPSPVWSNGSNEEWPDTGVAPDPSHRDSLVSLEQELYDCMLNCLPSDPAQWEGPPLSSSRSCFESRVPELSVRVGIVETFRAIGAILKTYPNLTFFCHEAGHKAGAAAFEAGVPLEVSIPAVGDYCVHGAVHGLLDGFAFSEPSLDDFDRIADICQNLPNSAQGGCTDGMGHASWDAYEDFSLTTAACATIEDLTLRYACDEGVLMRRYERIGGVKGTRTEDYKEFTARLREDCSTWAEVSQRTKEPGGPGAGCWSAVQYMLWEPIVYFARSYPDERWRGVDNLGELFEEMRSTCASFGPSGESLCRARDGYHVAAITNYVEGEFSEVCALLKDRVATCVAKAEELYKSNSGA